MKAFIVIAMLIVFVMLEEVCSDGRDLCGVNKEGHKDDDACDVACRKLGFVCGHCHVVQLPLSCHCHTDSKECDEHHR
uniref:Defensin-4 n=1 Tax=Androctonus bicolor TaxID=748906 RepID=A0A0K0LBU1_9SCOR|nr:defensin-4 [Androctonus bicolor]